ncbi:MAG: hypothetical protein MI864_09835 [Pseudomonadales bacterium]|nr:hypothetical protein [Pseudomonadales bacterium]
MKHLKTALIVIFGCLLYGCGKATVVFECEKPTSLEVVKGIDIGGELSLKKAKGAITAKLGEQITAEFASADPNKWISIAKTYQYQTCQLISSSSCGDLSESECFDKKKRALDEAYDKINDELKSENEKLELFQKNVSACIKDKTDGVLERKFSQPGGVRCPGGGCFMQSGSCNKRETNVEYQAPSNYYISRYKLIQGGTNDGTTGPVKAVNDDSGQVIKISAYIACDPADRPGADGGWNNITLEGELTYSNPDSYINQVKGECENSVRASM